MSDGPYMAKAYEYVESVADTADDKQKVMWHGWALRQAFIQGFHHGRASRDNLVEAARGVVREMGCHISPKLYYAIIALEKALIEAKK